MKALVIGATGATGKDLVDVLLDDPAYTEVAIFVRRSSGRRHPKLSEHVVDFRELGPSAGLIRGDVWFSSLGTTLKAAGSKDAQWAIDFDIPVAFGTIAKANWVRRCVLLSAYGAAVKSRVFYSRMKGELELRLRSLNFDSYVIFRPGLLLRRDTDRMAERIFAGLLAAVNTVGLFRRFKGMPTRLLAEKMARAGKSAPAGEAHIELEKIFSY